MRLSAKLLLINGIGGAALGFAFAALLLVGDAFGLRHRLFGDPDAVYLDAMFAAQWALIGGVSVGATAVIAPSETDE